MEKMQCPHCGEEFICEENMKHEDTLGYYTNCPKCKSSFNIGSKYDLKCSLCEELSMKHHEHNGTHIYVCELCPNIQLEYIDKKDLENFNSFMNR